MKLFCCIAFVLFFLLSVNSFAQEISVESIDTMQSHTIPSMVKRGEFEQVIVLSIDLVKQANEINYPKGMAIGYFQIANSLWSLGRNQESLRYLTLAGDLAEHASFNGFKIRVLDCYGRNYAALKIHRKAIEKYDEALTEYNRLGLNNKNLLALVYNNKASVFDDTGQSDSAMYYLRKSIEEKPTAMEYIGMAYQNLNVYRDIDSAAFYLTKAQAFSTSLSAYQQLILELNFGSLYLKQGKYDRALKSFNEALLKAQNLKRFEQQIRACKLISETYESMGQKELSYSFLQKHIHLKDSINLVKNAELNAVVDQFLRSQEEQFSHDKKRLNSILLGILILSVLAISFIFVYFRKKRKARLFEVKQKDKIIQQKEAESEQLKQKLNTAFDEVAMLAVGNSPFFLARFQEVYPDVCEKLLEINPNLVNTELALCAMIWLNFSSKEIARFTYVQPKTVQVKKYRLRKKLSIPSNADIYFWIKNL